jgi:hypothetical protein
VSLCRRRERRRLGWFETGWRKLVAVREANNLAIEEA